MRSLLLSLLFLVPSLARADCEEVDTAVLAAHVGWVTMALRVGQQARVGDVYALLREDLDCLAGSGLKTRDTDLFLALAAGALERGDEPAAVAALRAVLLIRDDYQLPAHLVPAGHPLHEAFAVAGELGPDVAGFKAEFLGQAPPAPTAVSAPPGSTLSAPSPEALAAMERERFLAELRAEVEVDEQAHRVGGVIAMVGGSVAGLSLAAMAARATSGANKATVQLPPQREIMGKVWAGTAIGGGATMGLGLWLMHVSQLEAGAAPMVGLRLRF